MTLEAIRKSIMDEAEEKASALEREASEESERIINEAEERGKQAMKDAQKDAEHEAERMRRESKAAADVEANSMLLESQGEAVDKALKGVMSELVREAAKANMRKLLEKGIKEFAEASGGREVIVKTSKRNSDLVKGLDAKVEFEDIDGFILSTSDSKIALNATVENIVDSQSDMARRLVSEELFGGMGRGQGPATARKRTVRAKAPKRRKK